MMEAVTLFRKSEHLEQVEEWCRVRGMNVFPVGWLPLTGWIVPGIAALWLYETNSYVAFVENVISNPDTTSEERWEALDSLMAFVVEYAKRNEIRYLIGASRNPKLLEHAKVLGWTVRQDPVHQMFMEITR